MQEFEKQRRELVEAAKQADKKDKEHQQQIDSLLRSFDDAKEMVRAFYEVNCRFFGG